MQTVDGEFSSGQGIEDPDSSSLFVEFHCLKPNEKLLGGSRRRRMTRRKKKEKEKQQEFEFCRVCRLNHEQGRGHIYFPSHKRSLSSFLSRFLSKLSDVRFFLSYPSVLHPQQAPSNSLWCVFCDSNISELHSSFACENSIKHLACAEHLNNVTDFLRKHGGGMDRVDSFRVSDADLVKWERKCKSLKDAASAPSEGSSIQLFGPSKDIHYELNSVNMDRYEKNSHLGFESSFSNSVLPLQSNTNENYQVSHPEVTKVANFVPVLFSLGTHGNMDVPGMNTMENTINHRTVSMESQHTNFSNNREGSVSYFCDDTWVQRKDSGESSSQAFQNFTQIGRFPGEPTENVHSGAPPPWLEMGEESWINLGLTEDLSMNRIVSHLDRFQKSRKLNPKRVGAAWAEKRRIELEREKRGEIVANNCDDNWLPNFGRVWQAGTRKESRKEFEMEKQTPFEVQNAYEASIVIQPYKSKRARKDAAENGGPI